VQPFGMEYHSLSNSERRGLVAQAEREELHGVRMCGPPL